MSKIKSSNRTAWARSEGIFEVVTGLCYDRLRCRLCEKEMHPNAIVRAAHGKKHVREGTARARVEYDTNGPRTVYEAV